MWEQCHLPRRKPGIEEHRAVQYKDSRPNAGQLKLMQSPTPLSPADATGEGSPKSEIKVEAKQVNFFYGSNQALFDVSLQVSSNAVTALIGPSGCGKSTFLRCINRMNDEIAGSRVTGQILIDGEDILKINTIHNLRKRVGMVFQKPTPFDKSIYENVAYGPKRHGIRGRSQLDEIVERCLTGSALWTEVKDKLHQSALGLSGGQQQRLCIARAMAVDPEVILMDEPCSALDPVATSRIEDLIRDLRSSYTIVIVTHNMNQAQRASDYTAFFLHGRIIEHSSTQQLFLNPRIRETEDYISGRFG